MIQTHWIMINFANIYIFNVFKNVQRSFTMEIGIKFINKKLMKMARFEEKIEISTTDKVVFDILRDPLNYARWNLITDESKKIGENKYEVKSKIGKIFVTQKEAIPNERLRFIHEESPFNEIGEIIKPKADGVEVTLWGEIKDEKQLTT